MVKLSEGAQEALDTAKIDIKMNEIVNYIVKEHIANERKR